MFAVACCGRISPLSCGAPPPPSLQEGPARACWRRGARAAAGGLACIEPFQEEGVVRADPHRCWRRGAREAAEGLAACGLPCADPFRKAPFINLETKETGVGRCWGGQCRIRSAPCCCACAVLAGWLSHPGPRIVRRVRPLLAGGGDACRVFCAQILSKENRCPRPPFPRPKRAGHGQAPRRSLGLERSRRF